MSRTLQRQNTVSTLQTAVGWLRQTPALVAVFLVLGVVTAAGQLNPLVSLLGNLLNVVVAGLVYRSAADLAWDRPLDLRENARLAGRRFLSLFGIGIVVFVATFLASLLLVIPGIYVGLRLGLAPVACMVDELGVGDSLSTSWDVAQGNLFKLLGIQLVTGSISLVVALVALSVTGGFQALLDGNSWALFEAFLIVAPVSAVIGPVAQFAIARVYLENRETEPADDENLTAQPGDDEWGDSGEDHTADPWDDESGDTQSESRWDEN